MATGPSLPTAKVIVDLPAPLTAAAFLSAVCLSSWRKASCEKVSPWESLPVLLRLTYASIVFFGLAARPLSDSAATVSAPVFPPSTEGNSAPGKSRRLPHSFQFSRAFPWAKTSIVGRLFPFNGSMTVIASRG